MKEDTRKEFEHIFMTPTFIKDFTNMHTKTMWHNAQFDLSDAERIVFLGCSLPQADYEFRYLLLKTAVRNPKNKIRVVIYPGSPPSDKKETKKHFKTLFVEKDIKFEEVDIADFLTDPDLIWHW